MNSSPASLVGILDSLSIGISRTSIRQAHTQTRFRKKKYNLTGFTPGHGENIYVFNHIENGMVIYSHEPILKRDSQKYLSQIPFTVKKQKPPVIRADYWQPLCMFEFGPGQGVVGRSVFQKLREFRALHELDWGWQAEEFKKLSRQERGNKIHNQKPNAVADIAAALAGAGRGNLMWMSEKQARVLEAAEAAAAEAAAREAEEKAARERAAEAANAVENGEAAQTAQEPVTPAPATPETHTETVSAESTPADATQATGPSAVSADKAKPGQPAKRLHKATIYWSNDADLYWAREWSENVEHEVGLPDGVKVWRWQTREIMAQEEEEVPQAKPEEKPEDGEQGQDGTDAGKQAEVEAKETEPQPETKKGWLGWLGGKTGGSGQDARP